MLHNEPKADCRVSVHVSASFPTRDLLGIDLNYLYIYLKLNSMAHHDRHLIVAMSIIVLLSLKQLNPQNYWRHSEALFPYLFAI